MVEKPFKDKKTSGMPKVRFTENEECSKYRGCMKPKWNHNTSNDKRMDSSLLHVWDFFSVEDHKYKGTEINPKQQAPPGADDQRHAIKRKTGDFWTLRTKTTRFKSFVLLSLNSFHRKTQATFRNHWSYWPMSSPCGRCYE